MWYHAAVFKLVAMGNRTVVRNPDGPAQSDRQFRPAPYVWGGSGPLPMAPPVVDPASYPKPDGSIFGEIIAYDFLGSAGGAVVTISPTDQEFNADSDCGTWTRIS